MTVTDTRKHHAQAAMPSAAAALTPNNKKRTWQDEGTMLLSPHQRGAPWSAAAASWLARCHRRAARWRKSFRCENDATAIVDAPEEAMEIEQGYASHMETSASVLTLQTLPMEIVATVTSYLDGDSILCASMTCRTLAQVSFDRKVWQDLCKEKWPTLRAQVLPQLPGAPDYDLIRLYGGSWRRCYVEKHRANQRAELTMEIPHFADRLEERLASETFTIGEHRFCLWVFPNGNPNENDYLGRVLSVYLVLTDLDQRPSNWLTCAVFSLAVVNHKDPRKRIEWHSCLVDNKFDSTLNNWGVHSLGSLKALRNPANGFLHNGALTVSVKVRLMSITFRVVFESDLKAHRHLGLADLTQVESFELPFCCSLMDLLNKLRDDYNLPPEQIRVWCFNQPVVSGQALRPRKLLNHPNADKTQPLFGNILCDGVDIDAYSFCQIYVENTAKDDIPLDSLARERLDVPESSVDCDGLKGFLFVKIMNPFNLHLEYLGRMRVNDQLSANCVPHCIARRLNCSIDDLRLYKEEIAPTMLSGPLFFQSGVNYSFHPGDIVVVTPKHIYSNVPDALPELMRSLLWSRYESATALLQRSFGDPPLSTIEDIGEKLDIPKFRVRSAFRKCKEDGRQTLQYIMEGRHLGFICDSCGETDFKGPRFNCSVCSDYDLCQACNAQCHQVNHRYANVDGKWQRIFNFKEHRVDHPMREMLPVFHQYK